MIKLLMRCNFWLESQTESKPKEQRTLLSKIYLNGLKLICRHMVYWCLIVCRLARVINVQPLNDNNDLPIISLTTFPGRIDNLWMVLYCIFQQTIKPSKIVVTLIREEINGGLKSLPSSLKFFIDKGVEFSFEDINLRPHNKYFYVRQKYPNRNIITIDDDLLYYPDTIERLLKMHKLNPDCVCSNRIQQIGMREDGFTPSNYWELVYKKQEPSHKWLGLGYSAVLYPHNFISQDLYDVEKIKTLSLMADDMWLKIQEMIADVKVVNGDYYAHPITLPTSQKIALQKDNNALVSRNDKYLRQMFAHYKDLLLRQNEVINSNSSLQ